MENKLEVGMYVRFKYGIRKIEKIESINNQKFYCLDESYISDEPEYHYQILESEILNKPSYDITDLLEINDIAVLQYKNKYNDIVSRKFEVERITDKYINFVSRRADWIYDREEKSFIDDFNLGQPVIKQILTHEQFEQNSYKIGE